MVVVERATGGAAKASAELLQLLVGPRSPHLVSDVEPGQRADPVDALRVAEIPPVGGLEVRPGLDRLAQVLPIGAGGGAPPPPRPPRGAPPDASAATLPP